ncbi:MAG: hypothetical protein WAW26_00410 [Anaerolineae bacterium]
MKTQRQFLCAAWLTVCALLLLSACRGPTPIAGRVTEITATRVASNTPLPATPTASYTPTAESTATSTPKPADTATPTDTNTPARTPTTAPIPPESSATATQEPDDAKPGRPTETPAVLNITPPEISGYAHSQKEDGTWVYRDGTGKEVAHIVTYNWEGLNWKKTIQRGALVVSDEKLMANLLKTASEGRGKSEIPLFPLPFNPEGLELQEKDIRGVTVIAIQGHIQQVVQPFPGGSPTLYNDFGSYELIVFSPTNDGSLQIIATNFESPLKPFYQTKVPFLQSVASDFSRANLPGRFGLPGASAAMAIGSSSGGKPLTLGNFLSFNGFTVAADH